MAGIYRSEWDEVPGGYYADPEIKSRHDQKVRENRRFDRLVENELGKMGYDRHDPSQIPTESEIGRAEEIARRKF
jgi:hypothetical protein